MLRAIELLDRRAPAESSRRSTPGPAALEDALIACLAALAELAGEAGQVERALRLREAAGVLHGPPLLPAGEPAGWKLCPLTARELEVVDLIVQGLTNRQIADELVISERTADTHLQNILNKLGLKSRAQVAAWFVQFVRSTQTRGQHA